MGRNSNSRQLTRRLWAAGAAAVLLGSVASVAAASLAATPAWATTSVHCPTDNLQAAIDAAPPGSTISISGTCTGNFEIDNNVTLVGPATLDGDWYGTVLYVDGPTVTLNLLTIQHGSASSGGGIHNDQGSVTLNSSTVSDNRASNYGGGIDNFQGTLTLNNSTVSGNSTGTGGGGIASAGGTVTIKASTVSGNHSGDEGGGIGLAPGTTGTISGSTFSGNSASYGGGIGNHGTLTVSGSTVTANCARYEGAGIFNDNEGILTLKATKVTNNHAGSDGGGIWNNNSETTIGSTISGNTPDQDS